MSVRCRIGVTEAWRSSETAICSYFAIHCTFAFSHKPSLRQEIKVRRQIWELVFRCTKSFLLSTSLWLALIVSRLFDRHANLTPFVILSLSRRRSNLLAKPDNVPNPFANSTSPWMMLAKIAVNVDLRSICLPFSAALHNRNRNKILTLSASRYPFPYSCTFIPFIRVCICYSS